MGFSLESIPDWLLPTDEADPKSVRRYRLRVAMVACGTFLTTFLVALPAAVVMFSRIAPVAYAGDVDQKIKDAIAPIQADVAAIKTDQRDIKAIFLAQSLMQLKRNQCEAIKNDRPAGAWTEQIQKMRTEFKRVTGEEFDMPDCREV